MRQVRRVTVALAAGLAGLVFGLLMNRVTTWFEEAGPVWGGLSFRGNGAIIFLYSALLGMIATDLLLYRRGGSRLAIALFTAGTILGLFVVVGGA